MEHTAPKWACLSSSQLSSYLYFTTRTTERLFLFLTLLTKTPPWFQCYLPGIWFSDGGHGGGQGGRSSFHKQRQRGDQGKTSKERLDLQMTEIHRQWQPGTGTDADTLAKNPQGNTQQPTHLSKEREPTPSAPRQAWAAYRSGARAIAWMVLLGTPRWLMEFPASWLK